MTQTHFAEMLGTDATTISRWENGKIKPHPKAWQQIKQIALKASAPLDAEVVRRSHVLQVHRLDEQPNVPHYGVQGDCYRHDEGWRYAP